MALESLKRRIAVPLFPVSRFYMKSFPVRRGKFAVWNTINDRLAWRDHSCIIHTNHGFRLNGNTRDLVAKCIYYFGTWEPPITDFVRRNLSAGDVFVDVGANIGYYSLLASTLVGPEGRVVAVEASPRIFPLLQSNLDLNHAANVRPVHMAASDTVGELTLFAGPESNSGQTTTATSWAEARQFEAIAKVPARPLADMLTPDEIQHTRIIKVDVEGAEWNVTKGILPVVERARQDVAVVMEISPADIAAQGGTWQALVGAFSALGFNAYTVEPDYTMRAYLTSTTQARPRRLTGDIVKQVDIIFSRVDQPEL